MFNIPDITSFLRLIVMRYKPKTSFKGINLAHTITCNGGGNYHPSGLRNYTHREYACLQTFPLHHQFPSQAVMKQIGNAMPPLFAKMLVMAMIAALKEEDQ